MRGCGSMRAGLERDRRPRRGTRAAEFNRNAIGALFQMLYAVSTCIAGAEVSTRAGASARDRRGRKGTDAAAASAPHLSILPLGALGVVGVEEK